MKQTQKSIMAVCLSALTIFGTSGINAQTPQALQSLSGNKSANKATEQEAQYIYTAGEFLSYIAQSGNNGEEYFKLATDIDICEALTDIASHLSIPYGVTLDGNGHTLTCKPIKGSDESFAVISSNYGTIKNLKVVSSTNSEDLTSIQATELPASSFIMENGGNLENCCFETELNVTDYSGTPFGKYGAVINSLTGGSITNCHIKTTILGGSSIDKLFATSGSAFVNTINANGCLIENCIVEAFGQVTSAAAWGEEYARVTYPFACADDNGTAQISNCHVVNTYTAQGSKNNTASLFVNNDQQVGYTLADNTTSVELFNSLKDMDPLRNTFFVNTSADGTEVLDHYFEYMLETYKGHIVLSSNAIAAKLTSADGLANYQSIYQQAERLETVLPTNIDLSAPKYTMYPMCPLTTIPAGITVDMMGEEIQVLNKIPFVKEVEEGATLKNVNIIAGEKINNNPDILHLFEPMPLGMICGTNNGTLESCKFSAMGGVPMLGDYGNTTGITDAPDIEPKLIFGLIAGENNGTISNCTSQIGDSQLSTEYNWASGPDVISSGTLLDITAGNIVGINNETGVITDCFAGGTLRVTSDFTTPTATAPVKCGHICGVNSNTEDALTNTYYCTSTDFSSEAFTGAYNSDGARQEDKESRGADGTRVYVYSEGGDVSGAVYCNKEEFINYFSNPGKWLIHTGSQPQNYYPDLTFSDIAIEIPEGDNLPLNITIESQEDVETLTDYFTNMPGMFSNANITFTQNIVMEEQTLESNDDFENITNYFEGIGSKDIPFTGTLKGENEDGEGIEIVNFTANLNGNCIFNNIDENATVEGITFTNAQVYATKTMEVEVDTETDGNKTATTKTVLPIFNDVNKGTIKNCGFSGKVVTADYIDATTEICLIGENNGHIEKCLFVIDFDEPAEPASPEGNKSCIVLKQNIGIGRNTGTVKKVAINKPKSSSNTNSTNKSTIINHSQFSEAEINSDTRYYTDEELASGEAAYWMNFDGQGYSENYSPIWKMGLKQPILARKGAQDAVYKLDIATDQTSSAISGPMFANAGEEVTVSYSGSPKQILLNNTTIPSSNYGAGTLTFTMPQPSVLGKGNVLLDVLYSSTPVKGISCGLSVSAEGSSIAIAGADADMACIYNTAGQMVSQVALADGCGMASVANKGIYIVKAGSQTAKVMVR